MIRHLLRLAWNRKQKTALIFLELLISLIVTFAVCALGVAAVANFGRPLGFDYRQVVSIRLEDPDGSNDRFTPEQQAVFQTLLRELNRLPEVEAAAGTICAPFTMMMSTSSWEREGGRLRFEIDEVTDDLNAVLKFELLEGRWFGPEDDGIDTVPVVLTKSLADVLFPGGGAAGQPFPTEFSDAVRYKVVGVVRDYRKHGDLYLPFHHLFYRKRLSAPQERPPEVIVARLAGPLTADVERLLERTLRRAAPGVGFQISDLQQARADQIKITLAPLLVLLLVAAFLLFMVMLGLTGVCWQSISHRRAEIGLRRAAGATARHVIGQLVGEALATMTLVALVGAILILQLPILGLSSWLPGPQLFVALALAIGLLYLLVAAAAFYPAYLAAGLRPAEALRAE